MVLTKTSVEERGIFHMAGDYPRDVYNCPNIYVLSFVN